MIRIATGLGLIWASSASYVDPMNHHISIVSPKNFDSTIQKPRDKYPSAVLFYNRKLQAKSFIDKQWEAVATTMKGMIRVGALDCNESREFCASNLDKSSSVAKGDDAYEIIFYPTFPLPAWKYAVRRCCLRFHRFSQGKMEASVITKSLTQLIQPANIRPIHVKDDDDDDGNIYSE